MTHTPTRTRRAAAAMLTALLAIALSAAGITPATAASTTTVVTGKILNANGKPAADTWVELSARPQNPNEAGLAYFRLTAADGTYTLDVPSGTKLTLMAQRDATHSDTWYGGNSDTSAKLVTVSGATYTAPTITRARGTNITARIYNKGKPAGKGWTVTAKGYDPVAKAWASSAWHGDADTTDANGNIYIEGLRTGTKYRLVILPEKIEAKGNLYADWPYYLDGGLGLEGAPARTFKAGTVTLGNLHMDKLNPAYKHGLKAPKLSKTKQTYGHSSTATVTVTHSAKKTGKVTLYAPGIKVGTAKLVKGKATFNLPKTLPVGTPSLYAILGTEVSNYTTFTVVKAKLAKTPTITGRKFKKNTKPKVTINLGKLNTGKYPTGKVNIYVGKKVVKTLNVKAKAKGKVTTTLPTKYAKAIKVKATYTGNTTTAKATTKTRTLKMK